ncbi:MAG: aldo/keto reductase [Candidatus Cloacimonetes bacterium]|nr:aldo/keto reductase [Candidatus Cloacimonadota bacterium]
MQNHNHNHLQMMYGTAWKEDRTKELTLMAIRAGFRAIDTANQRKHYHEAGVGEALQEAYSSLGISRSDLFLQTKFTFLAGQDHRLPYDPEADTGTQVRQSFEKSLNHLNTDSLDSYVLHGPSTRYGLASEDWEAWAAMEDIYNSGLTRHLGISNISADQLELLLEKVRIKPRFVQNRCYARLGWDKTVRAICNKHNIIYQGFSLLTANIAELNQAPVHAMAQKYKCQIPQIVFSFAHQLKMLPLTGTSSQLHMQEDLKSIAIRLEEDEVQYLENIG